MSLEPDLRDWQDLAVLDPLGAVLALPDRKFGRWDPAEFFATGEGELHRLLSHAGPFGVPAGRDSALDFGCGPGRLAPAIAERFRSYRGVDISPSMVREAQRLHAALATAAFDAAPDQSLDRFADDSFDLVVSLLVLQHVPQSSIKPYLRSMTRVLRPGGLLVFQLPDHIPPPEKILYDGRRLAYRGLRRLGFSAGLLYRRLHLSPMAMNFLSEAEAVEVVTRNGARIVDVERPGGGMAIDDCVYYVTK